MLKILQARLQQYVNQELSDVQARFRKGRGTGDQIANIRWIIEKAREFHENMHFCSIDYAKVFDSVQFSSVHLLSRVRRFATPGIATRQASLSITNSQNSLKLVRRVSDAIQPSHLLSSPSPHAFNLSQHQGLFQ